MKLKEFKRKLSFGSADRIFIDDIEADLSSHIGKNTAYQQAPFLGNFGIRLVLPRLLIRSENEKINVETVCFGKGWEGQARPPLGIASYSIRTINKKNWKEIIALQTKSDVNEQLLQQAKLFKEKSDFFSPYRICPPAGDILVIRNTKLNTFWPRYAAIDIRVNGNFHFEYNLQISKEYLDTFGFIYAVEVENAYNLEPGSWEIKNEIAYNPYIKKEYLGNGKQLEIGPKSTKTNFINGYYIDWDIFGCDKEILNV